MVGPQDVGAVFVYCDMDRIIGVPLDRGVDRAAKDIYVDGLLHGYAGAHNCGEFFIILIKAVSVDTIFH